MYSERASVETGVQAFFSTGSSKASTSKIKPGTKEVISLLTSDEDQPKPVVKRDKGKAKAKPKPVQDCSCL
jgi:hypothetical protein